MIQAVVEPHRRVEVDSMGTFGPKGTGPAAMHEQLLMRFSHLVRDPETKAECLQELRALWRYAYRGPVKPENIEWARHHCESARKKEPHGREYAAQKGFRGYSESAGGIAEIWENLDRNHQQAWYLFGDRVRRAPVEETEQETIEAAIVAFHHAGAPPRLVNSQHWIAALRAIREYYPAPLAPEGEIWTGILPDATGPLLAEAAAPGRESLDAEAKAIRAAERKRAYEQRLQQFEGTSFPHRWYLGGWSAFRGYWKSSGGIFEGKPALWWDIDQLPWIAFGKRVWRVRPNQPEEENVLAAIAVFAEEAGVLVPAVSAHWRAAFRATLKMSTVS